jgi:hypothetical protein
MTIYFLNTQGHIIDTNYKIIESDIIFRKCYGNIALDHNGNIYYIDNSELIKIKTSHSVDDIISLCENKIIKMNGYWHKLMRDMFVRKLSISVDWRPIISYTDVKKIVSISGTYPYNDNKITYISTDNNYWNYDSYNRSNKLIKKNVIHVSFELGELCYSSPREYIIHYYFYDKLKNFYSCSTDLSIPRYLLSQFNNDNCDDEIIDTHESLLLMNSGKVIKIDMTNNILSEYSHCKNKKILSIASTYDDDLRSIVYLLQSSDELILVYSIDNTVKSYNNCAFELQRNRFFTTKKALA